LITSFIGFSIGRPIFPDAVAEVFTSDFHEDTLVDLDAEIINDCVVVNKAFVLEDVVLQRWDTIVEMLHGSVSQDRTDDVEWDAEDADDHVTDSTQHIQHTIDAHLPPSPDMASVTQTFVAGCIVVHQVSTAAFTASRYWSINACLGIIFCSGAAMRMFAMLVQ
jgi:hypothetical protein